MTIIDYLFLGGSIAAGVYLVHRLFLGWSRSRADGSTIGGAEELTTSAPSNGRRAGRPTTARWLMRESPAEDGAEK